MHSTCCVEFFFLMIRPPPRSTRTDTLFPYTTLFRSKYAQAGRAIRERMLALTPLVEPLSIDEAFLDLSGTQALHHGWPARSLARLALEIERAMGLTASVGLSSNKLFAKIASDLDQPPGFRSDERPCGTEGVSPC